MSKPIFRLRMTPIDADRNDDIRHLKAVLKWLLRRFRFRVLSVEQEQQDHERETFPQPYHLSAAQRAARFV